MVEHLRVYHERRGGKLFLRTILQGGKLDAHSGLRSHSRALECPKSEPQLDISNSVIHLCITMSSTASVRDLRNHFPKVRKLLEAEGEVLLTESGTARYRLTSYSTPTAKIPLAIDYWARLTAYQPKPISTEAAQALDEENRGNR
jgi:hypothetical protein